MGTIPASPPLIPGWEQLLDQGHSSSQLHNSLPFCSMNPGFSQPFPSQESTRDTGMSPQPELQEGEQESSAGKKEFLMETLPAPGTEEQQPHSSTGGAPRGSSGIAAAALTPPVPHQGGSENPCTPQTPSPGIPEEPWNEAAPGDSRGMPPLPQRDWSWAGIP